MDGEMEGKDLVTGNKTMKEKMESDYTRNGERETEREMP